MHLIVVDMQEKLCPHISEIENIKKSIIKLIKAFRTLNLPVTVTEQEKLGETIEDVRNALGEFKAIKKTSFSCMGEQELVKEVVGSREVLLSGIEAHICIIQTALDMADYGFNVSVVSDAIGSRSEYDKQMAIMRMVEEGVRITTVEAVIYDLLRDAKHEKFKEVLEIVKK